MTASPTLELRKACKSYGDFAAVRDLSLAVPPGTIFGLLGPNGAGKTTTIRMIMDIIAPDSGEVRLFGSRREPADLLRIGYLPEERGLYQKMRVRDHLVFLARLRGLSRREAVPRIDHWLEAVELADRAGRRVEELSKGMQQKLQLVATVIHDPELLILDEPFSGLDPINQGLFKDLLAEYKTRGKAILFSTHVMEQAEKLCDAICLISRGRAILSGALSEIKARFGGTSYRIEAAGDLDRAAALPQVEQSLRQDGALKVLLRPEASPEEFLRLLVEVVELREFRSEAPGLEEIFVKAVREAG